MRHARPRRATRRGYGLLAGLLTAALGAGLLVVAPTAAHAADNSLQLPGGNEWVELGANAALFIDGSIAFNDHCTSDGEGGVDDFVYPATDVYIVPAGADEDGAQLVDAAGSANTIVGTGSGAFLGELIAAVYPSGKLGDGEYDIVYDTCQDGKVSESDAIWSDAIVVDVADGEIPPVDPSIQRLKEKARQEYVAWLQMHIGMTALFSIEDAKELAVCILEANVDCLAEIVLGMWLPSDPYSAAVDGFQDQVLSLIANRAANYGAIWQDPADPQFDQFTTVEPKNVTVPPFVGSPVPDAFASLTEPLAQEGALADALLHALERYQGAQAKGDPEWALKQARAVRDLSTALDEHLDTDQSLSDLRGALAGKAAVLDAKLADGRAVINRIRTSGFSPAEQQALTNRGLSKADIRHAEDAFVARGPAYPLTTGRPARPDRRRARRRAGHAGRAGRVRAGLGRPRHRPRGPGRAGIARGGRRWSVHHDRRCREPRRPRLHPVAARRVRPGLRLGPRRRRCVRRRARPDAGRAGRDLPHHRAQGHRRQRVPWCRHRAGRRHRRRPGTGRHLRRPGVAQADRHRRHAGDDVRRHGVRPGRRRAHLPLDGRRRARRRHRREPGVRPDGRRRGCARARRNRHRRPQGDHPHLGGVRAALRRGPGRLDDPGRLRVNWHPRRYSRANSSLSSTAASCANRGKNAVFMGLTR